METFVNKRSHTDDASTRKNMKLMKLEKVERMKQQDDDDDDDNAAEFSHPVPWQKIEAENLDCDYALLFSKEEAAGLFKKLEEEVVYLTGNEATVQVLGKVFDIPRKQATYGDAGLTYTYSGVKRSARPWTPTLEYIRDAVTMATGHTFNFVLVNRYKDGLDHMGEHRDDEEDLDPACPIASVSLGATRDFVFRHRDARWRRGRRLRRVDPVKLELGPGSLLLMNQPTNTYWYHSLPIRRKLVLPRLNMTFRQVLVRPGGHEAPHGPTSTG